MAKVAAKKKAVSLKLHAPSAKKVSVAGSFNNWDMSAHPAKKDIKGNWVAKVDLTPGRHEYKFVVDGAWVNDPSCGACIGNAFGSNNCIVEVK